MNFAEIRRKVAACPLAPSAKLVLMTLASHADSMGRAWPARAHLMDITGLAERTLREVLAELRNEGEIEACWIEEEGVMGWRILAAKNTAERAAADRRKSGGTPPKKRRQTAGVEQGERRHTAEEAAAHRRAALIIRESQGKPIPERERGGEMENGKSLAENRVENRVEIHVEKQGRIGEEMDRPTEAQVLAQGKLPTEAIPEDVCRDYFDKNEASGWVTLQGRPIENWRADLRFYARCRRRVGNGNGNAAGNGARQGQGGPRRPATGGELMTSYAGTAKTAAAGDTTLKHF